MNNPADKDLEQLLSRIIASPELHSRWLNTLSLLEHMGSRKILSTQDVRDVDESLLRHASEEARHAHFFKKASSKINDLPDNYDSASLLAGYSGFRYFQRLDIMVQSAVEHSVEKSRDFFHRCYLYTSLIIEERAGWLYEIYGRLLKEHNAPFTLDGIIAEEEKHLTETRDKLQDLDPDFADHMNEFRDGEQRLFNTFFDNLSKRAG